MNSSPLYKTHFWEHPIKENLACWFSTTIPTPPIKKKSRKEGWTHPHFTKPVFENTPLRKNLACWFSTTITTAPIKKRKGKGKGAIELITGRQWRKGNRRWRPWRRGKRWRRRTEESARGSHRGCRACPECPSKCVWGLQLHGQSEVGLRLGELKGGPSTST